MPHAHSGSHEPRVDDDVIVGTELLIHSENAPTARAPLPQQSATHIIRDCWVRPKCLSIEEFGVVLECKVVKELEGGIPIAGRAGSRITVKHANGALVFCWNIWYFHPENSARRSHVILKPIIYFSQAVCSVESNV